MQNNNVSLKPLFVQPQKPLKPLSGMQHNLNEHFTNIRNMIPYGFADNDSRYIAICGLTPKITEDSLRLVCEEYGKVISITLRAYYREAQAFIVAGVTYENAQQAKNAFNELQKKVENGFHFQLFVGSPIVQQESRIVRIKLPNQQIRAMIDKLAKQVAKEDVEQIIKQREINNAKFAFLYFPSEENEYYKWRVRSYQNGEDDKQWKSEPYYFNVNEKIYIPPAIEHEEISSQNFAKKELEKAQSKYPNHEVTLKRKLQLPVLDEQERQTLSQMLRELNTQKHTIGKAMVFCMDHQNCAADIVMLLQESLVGNVSWQMKLARLYLVSDILHNCNQTFKNYIQWCLPKIYDNCEQLLPYKEKILKLLQCWREQNVFDHKYLKGLELSFLLKETPMQIESSSSQLYKEKLARVDDETLDRICRLKGLCSDAPRDTLVQRLVQHKFYNRPTPDVSLDQVNKYVQVYRHIVDKDQQTIMGSQKKSFLIQIQMMQEFLKLLQKRYKNIINSQGEEIDAIDERIYEFSKHIEIQRAERALYLSIDGKELTEEEVKSIDEKKVQVFTNYELSYLLPKPPLPPPPTDPIEIEVQWFREALFKSGLYDPFRIEEYVKSKRAQLIRVEQIKKERERQLLLRQEQEAKDKEREKERELQKEKERQKHYSRHQKRSSSSSRKKNSRHYKHRSRSDSRKRKNQKKR